METDKEYWIFADESVVKGELFSHFFGGCIVPVSKYSEISQRLVQKKDELGLGKELKWQRVTAQRLDSYIAMVTAFFDELRADNLRVRIMFQDNETLPRRSHGADRDEPYYKLYYQFLKHAFGFQFMSEMPDGTRLRLFLDQLPHTAEKAAQFKGYIAALPNNAKLRPKKLKLDQSHITEIDSKEYVLLQCVDIVLGAMAFRFNEKHLVKPEGQRTRGKRTIAKEKLYKVILKEIRTLKPHFHPKISTASEPRPEGRWSMPYRHWLFEPKS